jgi:formylglycine-generating enzyme required for sulfatase activity
MIFSQKNMKPEILIFKSSNLQIFKSSNLQIFKSKKMLRVITVTACLCLASATIAQAQQQEFCEMILVKGGTFTMGCQANDDAACDKDEVPEHEVTLRNFYIGKFEVTQAQWLDVMGQNPSSFKGGTQAPMRPVESVTYAEILKFIEQLNAKTGMKYRLPSEAEWEYAARGGAKSKGYLYSGSDNIDTVAWYAANAEQSTHPVGQKKPNELGLHDMSGNVWEWCSDFYSDYGYASQNNPIGPASGNYRVNRGGSYMSRPKFERVAFRGKGIPTAEFPGNFLGFRLARNAD